MHARFNLTEAKAPLVSSLLHFLSLNLNLTSFNLNHREKLELFNTGFLYDCVASQRCLKNTSRQNDHGNNMYIFIRKNRVHIC